MNAATLKINSFNIIMISQMHAENNNIVIAHSITHGKMYLHTFFATKETR